MRDLLDRETLDVRAAEAVALFCYQVKKWIGAFAAALGGLDTLVFAGGIGENAPASAPASATGWASSASNWKRREMRRMSGVISTEASRVTVRVIRTDEEHDDCALGVPRFRPWHDLRKNESDHATR